MGKTIQLTPATKAIMPFVATDPSRQALTHLLCTTDGTQVATDGHRLAVLTPRRHNPDELPTIQGHAATRESPDADRLLPGKGVKHILKAMPTKAAKRRPVLAAAYEIQNGAGPGEVSLGVTAPAAPQTFTLPCYDGPYPAYQRAIPTAPFQAHMALNPQYLKDACNAAIAIGATKLILEIGAVSSPIRLSADNDAGDTLTMVIMPMYE